MSRFWPLPLLAALLGLCGKSEDQELLEQRQAICEALVEQGVTVRDAADRFGGAQLPFDEDRNCRAGLTVLQGDRCGVAPGTAGDHHQEVLCRRAWQWEAKDATLCNVVLGCFYWCEVYSAPTSSEAAVDDSVVCAAHFQSGQRALPP